MALTDQLSVVTKYIYDLLQSTQSELGLADVWYGDQEKIPRTPCVAVDSGEKTRELNGAPRRTLVNLTIYIMIYHHKVQQTQASRQEVEALSDAVETLLHTDPRLGDNVIHCMVTAMDPGYLQRQATMLRATRLTLECTSQVQLPS